MRNYLVYDLPTRIFHWVFVSLFLFSFVIGKTVDDESLVFTFHMISGLMMLGLVIWRLIWGVGGTQYARFSGFTFKLSELKNYFGGILTGSKKKWSGHNPASSWAALAMLTLALGLALSGYLMVTGQKENFEDLHELMANTFVFIVVLHVSGVIFHMLRYQDGLALSMIDGKKEYSEKNLTVINSKVFQGIFLIFLIALYSFYLLKNFDSNNKSLMFFGQTLQLGDSENSEHRSLEMNRLEKLEKDDND